jgi:hypothetical protein
MNSDLFNYMSTATRDMEEDYSRIHKRVTEDPGTAGDNAEETWAELFRNWLPPVYRIKTKGRIMNVQGKCGPQVDVLVLSPLYPKALLKKKEYLEDGVVAAFECKLTLKAEHLRKAAENSAAIRRLASRSRKGTPYKELHGRIVYGLLAHSHDWKGEKSTPLENIEKHLSQAEEEEAQHPSEVIDMICVADLAHWGITKTLCPNSCLSLLPEAENRLPSSARLQHRANLWHEAQQRCYGPIETSYSRYSKEVRVDEGNLPSCPIGSMLTQLLQRLAWENPHLRSLAEHFLLTKVSGTAISRAGSNWPIGILSEDVIARLRTGSVLTSNRFYTPSWDEWSSTFF